MASTIRNTVLSFGYADVPVAIRKASERQDVKFDYAVKTDEGFKPRQQLYVAKDTDIKAAPDNTFQGVWVGDQFKVVDPEKIATVRQEGVIESIEVEEFVPLKDVPFERVTDAYYLTPQSGLIGAKPLRLLRDAIKGEKVAGLTKLCVKGGAGARQRLGAILENDGKLLLLTLAFADAWREADESADALVNAEPPRRDVLAATRELIRLTKVDPAESLLVTARDDTVAQREELFRDAIDGKPVKSRKRTPTKPRADADDLLAALRASIDEAEARKGKGKGKKAVPA